MNYWRNWAWQIEEMRRLLEQYEPIRRELERAAPLITAESEALRRQLELLAPLITEETSALRQRMELLAPLVAEEYDSIERMLKIGRPWNLAVVSGVEADLLRDRIFEMAAEYRDVLDTAASMGLADGHIPRIAELLAGEVGETFENLTGLRELLGDSLAGYQSFENVATANHLIQGIIESEQTLASLSESISTAHPLWRQQAELLGLEDVPLSIACDYAIASEFGLAARISASAELAISQIHWPALEAGFGTIDHSLATFRATFEDFSLSYRELYQDLGDIPQAIPALSPVVVGRPPVELLSSASLLRDVSHELFEEQSAEEYEEEREYAGEEISEKTEPDEEEVWLPPSLPELEGWLTEINPWLADTLRGARDALQSGGRDKVRHVCVSLRELFTKLLYELAPDQSVEKWSSDPSDFSNQRPTRKARLRYISRGIGVDSFTKFAEKDVETTLELLNLLQKGTHTIGPVFSNEQAEKLLVRMELQLLFLMRISEKS